MNRAALPAALFALFLAGCHHETPAATDRQDSHPVVVETTTVHRQAVTDRIDIPARVAANPTRVVRVFSQISGRVLALYVRPGQEVAKGQAIALIQSSDIAQARSDYEKARIEAARSELQLNRAQTLLQHEVLAQKDYDDLKAANDAAHSEVNRAMQRIHMLGFAVEGSSDTTTLKAPIAGAILDIGTATGEMQRSLDNASPIATIANLDQVWVLGDVYERDLATVKQGRPVNVTFAAYPGETVRGTIDNISDAMDPASLTLKARVVLRNPNHRYKPLMYATITIDRSTAQAFLVPPSAVIREGSQSVVFVQTAQGKYEKRSVSTGQSRDQMVEITSGLNDGDQVVIAGAALLRAPAGD